MTNDRGIEEQASGLGLNEVYYILFRHKWMILVCSLAGLLAAAGMYLTRSKVYESQAKLMVKYVQDTKSVSPVKDAAQIQSPDFGGIGLINSELEILSSMDLVLQAVDALGPDKVLAKAGGGSDRILAATLLMKNLKLEAPNRGNIIRVVLQHPDPEMVQPILRQLIETYKKKHQEIHRPFGVMDNWLTQETDRLRLELSQTDEELRKWKAKLGVISLEETKRSYIDEMSRIRQELFAAEAELQALKAGLGDAVQLAPGKGTGAETELGAPLKTIEDYKSLCAQLASLQAKEREMRLQYTPSNSLVQQVRSQIAERELLIKALEHDNPKLLSLNLGYAITAGVTNGMDLSAVLFKTKGLEAKTQALKGQLASIRAEANKLDEAESSVAQLQRKKEMAETNYRYFSESLDQARIDETLGAGKITNIPVIQEPTPPVKAQSRLLKILVMVALGGIAAGVGLAFVLELFIDQTVKRPMELGKTVPLRLMLSIPHLGRNGGSAKVKGGDPGSKEITEIAPWDTQHILRPYHEALRDRLITYFEVRNMTHKPKLVGVTSCSKGAGVTTLATGLAAALSETGEGNVLLVDMGLEQGAAHPFYKGKPGCGLSEALETEKRDGALIQANLYMVSAQGGNALLPRVLPKKFSHLVPKMKASDYDFIIFDLPPVSQTSVTSALAGFMDMTLMIVEGEKTNREMLKQAVSLLGDSKATVGGVFNKGRTYVPHWLQPEL